MKFGQTSPSHPSLGHLDVIVLSVWHQLVMDVCVVPPSTFVLREFERAQVALPSHEPSLCPHGSALTPVTQFQLSHNVLLALISSK
jgi:hypothetical protein